MADAEALVAIGGSAPLVLKVLGPTADYVGEELQQWTARRVGNVQRIFSTAARRLAEEVDEPGGVPPRMLREVFDGGSYWDDELGAEYFGGLLASSRTPDMGDDRAASLAALVGRLSSSQLRSHYVLYAHSQRLLKGMDLHLGLVAEVRQKARVYIPFTTWLDGMSIGYDKEDWPSIFDHCLFGLKREDLIADSYRSGDEAHLKSRPGDREFPAPGLVFGVSMLGVELFCLAHGIKKMPTTAFLDAEQEFEVETEIRLSDGAALEAELRRSTS